MVRAVPWGAMAVDPAIVPRQESVQGVEQIDVGAGPKLDDDKPGGCMRDEDAQQPVALTLDEPGAGGREVGEPRFGARPD